MAHLLRVLLAKAATDSSGEELLRDLPQRPIQRRSIYPMTLIAAFLVELFPTKIRYTSMSLPYHIGND
jgi:hypothetical protein